MDFNCRDPDERPDTTRQSEGRYRRIVRNPTGRRSSTRTGDAGSVDPLDLELALAIMKSVHDPGIDNINPELVKKGWTHQGLIDMFNACLRHAVFPRIWKRSGVKYLFKPGNREKTDPGSYLPTPCSGHIVRGSPATSAEANSGDKIVGGTIRVPS